MKFLESLILMAIVCVPVPVNAESPFAVAKPTQLAVTVNNPRFAAEPHSPQPEAPAVMEAVRAMENALANGDFDTYEKYLDNEVSTTDPKTDKLVTGKKAVLELERKQWSATKGDALTAYALNEPYIKVTGNMAVVTYKANKQFGPKRKTEEFVTNVLIKDSDAWKKVHDRRSGSAKS